MLRLKFMADQLDKVAQVFTKFESSESAARLWKDMFDHVSEREFDKAMKTAIAQCTFAPKPSDVLKLLKKPSESADFKRANPESIRTQRKRNNAAGMCECIVEDIGEDGSFKRRLVWRKQKDCVKVIDSFFDNYTAETISLWMPKIEYCMEILTPTTVTSILKEKLCIGAAESLSKAALNPQFFQKYQSVLDELVGMAKTPEVRT